MKKGFSLLELIFAIVIIGIIGTFAIPKYLETKDAAHVSTLKRDIASATTSIQSYHLLNQRLDKITDAIEINNDNWEVENLKMTFKENDKACVVLEVTTNDGSKVLSQTVDESAGSICRKLKEEGIDTTSYDLY